MSDEPAGFLARWSRRKLAPEPEATRAAEPEATRAAEPEAPQAAQPVPRPCPIPGLPEIDLTALPSISDLTASSDFSLFLRPGIPAALRTAALRRMWSLDAGIRDFIGPSDYAWDYNDPAGMPGGFSLDLGGDLKKLLAQAIGESEEAPPPAPELDAPPEAEAPPLIAEASAEPGRSEGLAEDAAPTAPRRRHGGAMPV